MCKDRIIVLLYLLSRLAYGGMGEMLAFLSVMHVILQCAMMYAGHTCREYVSCLAGILSYPLYETGNLQITIEVIPRIQRFRQIWTYLSWDESWNKAIYYYIVIGCQCQHLESLQYSAHCPEKNYCSMYTPAWRTVLVTVVWIYICALSLQRIRWQTLVQSTS